MKMNFGKKMTIALATAVLGSGMYSAMATPITVSELGTVDPGSPASPSDETDYLTALVNLYISSGSGTYTGVTVGSHTHDFVVTLGGALSLPTDLVNSGQLSSTGSSTSITVALPTGSYAYAMVKWGDTDEFYYITPSSGSPNSITLNNDTGNGNGESHWDLWTGGDLIIDTRGGTVPDGGTTALLLGLGVTGLGLMRRKLS